MTKPILELLVGLPRSGKSTYADKQRTLGTSVIVNPDSIRLALHGRRFAPEAEDFVWATAKVMVRSLFLAGHMHVLVDATNTTRARRDFWKSDAWQRTFTTIDTAVELCLSRAEGDIELQKVIQRMHDNFEPVAFDEWG